MAIKVSNTTVIDDSRQLQNISGIDQTTNSTLQSAGLSGVFISAPTITSPVNQSSGVIIGNGFVSSAFSLSGSFYGGSHDFSEWQISTSSTFSSIFDSYSGNSNLTSWVPSETPSTNTVYYVRVRYGSDGHRSPWSSAYSVTSTNIYVNQPTVSVIGSPSSVQKTPTISTSNFAVTGGTDTHVSTDWEIRKSSDNTLVWSSYNDTVNKTSITVPTNTLMVSTSYIFKARHRGQTYKNSFYGELTATTVALFDGEEVFTTPGTYTWVAPALVTSISVVCVGGGGGGGSDWSPMGAGGGGGLRYGNNINVTPGASYTVVVGSGGPGNSGTYGTPTNGGASSFNNSVIANGASGWSGGGGSGGTAGYTGGTGGNNSKYCGGGGAAGYSGNGGNGQSGNTGQNATAGSGGGGGGGSHSAIADNYSGGGGGGVGLYGEGTSGAAGTYGDRYDCGGRGGSGGQNGVPGPVVGGDTRNTVGGAAGYYGGGGGQGRTTSGAATAGGPGGNGAVRIVWPGNTRSFPSTRVSLL